MQLSSNEQREAEYQRRWSRASKLKLPSWWRDLAPGKGPRFWTTVEAMRKEAGVVRSDYSAISYIINKLRSGYERTK